MSFDYPVILSYDVGVIHLSYCLLTKKEFTKSDGSKYLDWFIIDWNNIDLTNRDEQKCHCGAKASLTNVVNNELKHYCKTHAKKVDVSTQPFEEVFTAIKSENKCSNETKSGLCNKKSSYSKNGSYYCTTHAKHIYKCECKQVEMKSFKLKSSTALNFDDVKYALYVELEKKKNLLDANYVVIENQPSFKNPRMKSIAISLYDYYLIRGIIDKSITDSKITQVKFMSPSNKLKLADDGDTKQLVKAKNENETKGYKMTKSLGIKYCLELIKHLPEWITHFNSHKKKDDLADSFLQGAYFMNTVVKPVVKTDIKIEPKTEPKPVSKKKPIIINKEIEL